MWAAAVLLCALGAAALWVPAQAAVLLKLEDDVVTHSVDSGREGPGKEDTPTTSGSQAPRPPPVPTRGVPARAESTAGPGIEDLSTVGMSTHSHPNSQTATVLPMTTDTSTVNVTDSTQTTIRKDAAPSVSLAGIVTGVLVATGCLAGVIFLFVHKMSK